MIVGHWAFAYVAKKTFCKTVNYPFLIALSYGPDFVDKGLSVSFGVPGRNCGHSLLVFCLLVAAAWALSKEFGFERRWVEAGAVMWAAHLAGDFVRPLVLFWPLGGSITGEPFAFPGVFIRMYVEIKWPGQLALEICLVTVAMALWIGLPDKVRGLAAVRAFRGGRTDTK